MIGLSSYFYNPEEIIAEFYLHAQVFFLFKKHDMIEELGLNTIEFNEILEDYHLLENPHDVKLFYSVWKLYEQYPHRLLPKIAFVLVQQYK